MDHGQYDYHDSEYPNPEEGYDEPNSFHDDSYDGNGYDGNGYGGNDYEGNGYEGNDGNDYEGNGYDGYPEDAYRDDQQPPQDAPPDDFDASPGLNGDPKHYSQIYQNDAGGVLDHDPITEYLKSKDPDWDVQPAEPKNLLDLPEDILRLIVKEASCTRCP